MKQGFSEGYSSMSAYPKSLVSIVATLVGLAVFLVLASLFMVSQPIGSYFYGVNRSENFGSVSLPRDGDIVKDLIKLNSTEGNGNLVPLDNGGSESETGSKPDVNVVENPVTTSQGTNEKSVSQPEVTVTSSDNPSVSKTDDIVDQPSTEPSSLHEGKVDNVSLSTNVTNSVETGKDPTLGMEVLPTVSPVQDCDLYHGQWVYDQNGPLYSNNSCPVLTQMQNCQGNGRPDKEYENWRWKPEHCDLPRFDPKKFLELMKGRTLAYIGDSVARNQMESMLCILWQVEVPQNRGNKRMQRYHFKSTNTMIVRIWSSWLVHRTSEPFDFAPEGLDKLHLDAPDEVFMEFVPQFDVIVLSSGHWFAKKSAYILNNEILGGQLWWPDKSRLNKINNVEAFGISVETILTSLGTHPNYTGLTIVRSFSPDHYEGGAWNTGGSCTGKVKPVLAGEIVENGFTNIMHEKQVNGFNSAMKKKTNKSKLKLMDITEAFSYRHDGHPGPYRSPDPNKITKRGKDGSPPPQDCLHWCMPGPVDTWNELVMEIIRREYEGGTGPS
ncbi:protein trichome birefringence-like 18 isoform X2 [Apium graveolens]|uniref:protein trichome birefringence-like 18 isoform X2 n=1 Tax=Apium graveolens TaxID=4045 RepID=UPI003D7A6931